ncbi:hypothetical protein HMPREF1624_02647 [Sporothrix schenckii ATCC 58251]|uniref:Zn(2)-C6 fungal-type domain-containing protein n=1 Tax=Sporothrix schenckii (strain ATCC 58251 / de Perez 2211183) TaxID=1391915 RepID=U7Q3Y7_SPOS1|nr:hypothetical protein HMPREF1624_02647 [Sporothrix schenckii ATCC 58251]
MVGVPGRSKGCNTCIQRKVKCDGGQPACGNCRKSNRLCTGYKRPVAFVMSSNVALGPDAVEDPEGGTIMTQGRWRKRVRKTPKALAKDPKPRRAHEPTPTLAEAAITELTDSSSLAPSRSSSGTPRAIDAVDLSTTVAPADIKQYWKQYIYHDTEDDETGADDGGHKHHPNTNSTNAQQLQHIIATRRGPMTVETLSRVISILESSANVALLDFASPMTLSASAAAAGSRDISIAGTDIWPVGSPFVHHFGSEAVWREQLFPMFLSFHLPKEIFSGCKTTTKSMRSRNWLLNLQDTSLDGAPALESAMTALCMARVGRRSGNMALVQHSLRLYTKGLRQLQDAIHDPATQLADQTLAACMAFSMYEVAECPSRHINGYYSHHTGGLALLKMRGPDAHITPLGHSLFVFMRVQQFIYALLMRKANFLCEPAWTNRPWQTSAKDPQDKFMDQMYCIPVLLEQTDKLAEAAAHKTIGHEALVRGYWDLIVQYDAIYRCLLRWHKDLQAIVAGPLYWPELSTIACPVFDTNGRGRPFAVAFHFPAFSIGQSVVLFWVIAMVVNYQIHFLYNRIIALQSSPDYAPGPPRVPEPTDDPLTAAGDLSATNWSPEPVASPATPSQSMPPGSGQDLPTADGDSSPSLGEFPPSIPAMQAAAHDAIGITRTVCNNICQSIEYFLRDEMGDVGPLSMMLPLTSLRHVLVRTVPIKPCPPSPHPDRPGETSDDVVWVDFLMRYIGAKGQQLANYLDDD